MPLRPKLGWTLVATSVGFIVVQLDVSIVNLALPEIELAFRTSLDSLQWLMDGYALVFAALLLTAGVLGDHWGCRRVFVAGLCVFALSSAICGTASSVGILIAARVVQGIGGALVLPTSLVLLSHACEEDETLRSKMVGWWSAAGALAMAAGPTAGGMLMTHWGWRSIFLVNIPISAFGIWITHLHVQDTDAKRGNHVDVTGQVLSLVAMVVLTWTVIEGGALGWSGSVIWIGFALALLVWILFFVYESTISAPMLSPSLFREKAYVALVFVGMCISLTFFGLIFVLSLYFQQVRGYTPLEAGLAFAPLTTTIVLANVAGGRLSANTGRSGMMVTGLVLGAVGYGWLLLASLDTATPFTSLVPGLFLISMGTGITAPAMTAAAMADRPANQSGMASAALASARQFGGVLGIALFGSLVAGGAEQFRQGAKIAFSLAAVLFLVAGLVALRLNSKCTR